MTAARATGAVFRVESVSMAWGPEAGPAPVDALAGDPAPRSYHLLPSVRGDLPARTGRTGGVRAGGRTDPQRTGTGDAHGPRGAPARDGR